MTEDPVLHVRGLDAAIEGHQITHGLDLDVSANESVGLVGRNGAGKSTTFRAIMGQIEILSGSIQFDGVELTNLTADEIPRLGIGYQPEDRKLFTGMSVEQNIRIPVWASHRPELTENEDEIVHEIFDIFSELYDHRDKNVENLSGGQAKMTSIGRALALQPDLLILDEPFEGLAPIIVERLKENIAEIIKTNDISVLIAEANVRHIAEVTDRLVVIDRGEIIASGDPMEIAEDEDLLELMQG
ncbi:ABC transporter ATP-binding protein [Natronorarus salvus]|uniref:ABC transporter ATP-binding protein n=1 Tax=Natronorarus salvus TaxID=3117733 RepID=UPI002F25F6FC